MARPQKKHSRRKTDEALDTRQALLQAALELVDRDKSFDALSLREVTREVGVVPTAFYRHFPDMQSLGLELVEDSFRTLRAMLKAAREGGAAPGELIRQRSIDTLVTYTRAHRRHFLFISRERFGGVAAIRQAIAQEIELIVRELATDLARFRGFEQWSTEDLMMLADLLVVSMMRIVGAVLDQRQSVSDQQLIETSEKQLRLIFLGVPQWRSASTM